MIMLYPFQEKKEKIRISAHYEIKNENLHISYIVDDKDHKIEDLYPLELTPGTGTVFPLENLWSTTCFEIFLKNMDGTDYYEFNFNSKGEWNLFYFSKYRQRETEFKNMADLIFSHHMTGDRCQLNYQIDLRKLDKLKVPCLVNVAVVVKTQMGATFWSQKHNGLKADFHDSSNFTLKL